MILRVIIFPVLSALLYWLSSQSFSFPLAVWVCLVPFGLSLYRSTPMKGLASGFVCGFGFWILAVWWLRNNLVGMAGLPAWQAWGWTSVFCAWHAVPYALFGYLAVRCRWLERPMGALLAAAALVVIRTWFPQIFPGNEAHNLYKWPLLIQVLDLGGVPLLLFSVYLVNFLIVRALFCWREKISILPAVVSVVVVFGLLAGYGGFRLHSLHREMSVASVRQNIRTVSVQPNVPIKGGEPLVPPEDRHNDAVTALAFSRLAASRYPDANLVVLPELPSGFACVPDAARELPQMTKETGIAFMASCVTVADSPGNYYNSVAYTDRNGVPGEEYHKNILVPFGEYIPLESHLPFLRRLFPGVMPFRPGKRTVLYDLGKGYKVIPALCYEAVFSDHIRSFVDRGGNVLINMVDDAWFGKSPASLTHLSLALYRTVEYRIPMIRVTNSGAGAFVQPTGEIVEGTLTPQFRRVITSAPLFIPQHRSLYFHIGEAFLHSLLLVLGVDAVLRWRNRKRRKDIPSNGCAAIKLRVTCGGINGTRDIPCKSR